MSRSSGGILSMLSSWRRGEVSSCLAGRQWPSPFRFRRAMIRKMRRPIRAMKAMPPTMGPTISASSSEDEDQKGLKKMIDRYLLKKFLFQQKKAAKYENISVTKKPDLFSLQKEKKYKVPYVATIQYSLLNPDPKASNRLILQKIYFFVTAISNGGKISIYKIHQFISG